MAHGGDDFFHQICGLEPQGRGVDAGMTADILTLQHILVDEQLDMVVMVVHQTHDTQGAGGDVQIFLHIAVVGKAQAGGADLLGQGAGLEDLVAGEHQQIEGGVLAVAQQQILADGGLQHFVDGGAGFHGHGGLVVDALVGDVQGVQQIIDPDFLGKPSGTIRGTAGY